MVVEEITRTPLVIDRFEGRHAFLSNFHESSLKLGKLIAPSVEHAYQAYKMIGVERFEAILKAKTPGQAKRMGRRFKIRSDWEDFKACDMFDGKEVPFKVTVMVMLERQKYRQDAYLDLLLRNTKEAKLIEGNWWHDNFWGDCTCPKCGHIEGENWLGKILEQVREECWNAVWLTGRAKDTR